MACTRVISKSSFSTLRQQCEVLTLYMEFKSVIENHREKHKHAIFHLKKSMIELIISQLSGECFYFEHIYLVATNTVIFLKTVPEILIAMQVYCLHLDIYIYVMKFRGRM